MTTRRTALSEWLWAGSPARRLLVSLVVTALVLGVPALAGYRTPPTLIGLFIGWDLGAWYMDKLYSEGRIRRAVAPAE